MSRTTVDPKRKALIAALAAMPEESFGWFVAWASGVNMQYPDGLGGFSSQSQASILKLRAEAKNYQEGPVDNKGTYASK
jgi:hypothetical protein